MTTKPQILLVDDEPTILKLHRRMLTPLDADVHAVTSAAEALEILATRDIHVLVSDECMPEIRGRELLARSRVDFPHVATILLTGYASMEAAMSAVNEGHVFRLLTKPCDSATLHRAIRQALDYQLLLKGATRFVESERRRRASMSKLEAGHPGIGDVERDDDGCIEIHAPSEADIKELEDVLRRASRAEPELSKP